MQICFNSFMSFLLLFQCTSYLDCDGYGKGEFVMCVNGQCKPNVPCNKDDDCAFYGKSTTNIFFSILYPLTLRIGEGTFIFTYPIAVSV